MTPYYFVIWYLLVVQLNRRFRNWFQRWQQTEVKHRHSTDRQPFDHLSRWADDWSGPSVQTSDMEHPVRSARQRQYTDTDITQVGSSSSNIFSSFYVTLWSRSQHFITLPSPVPTAFRLTGGDWLPGQWRPPTPEGGRRWRGLYFLPSPTAKLRRRHGNNNMTSKFFTKCICQCRLELNLFF